MPRRSITKRTAPPRAKLCTSVRICAAGWPENSPTRKYPVPAGSIAALDRQGRLLLAHQFHFVRLGGVAAQDRELHLRARLAAQQAHAFEHRRVARRLPVDRSHVVARPEARPGGCGTVARGDHPQVVLARDLEARVGDAGGGRIDGLHLLRIEVGAVGVEAIGESVHGAVHHLVDVHFLDVVVEDERDHVFENPQRPVALALGSGFPSKEAADDRKREHGQRHGKHGSAGSRGHGLAFSHCRGLTGRPSIRTSK